MKEICYVNSHIPLQNNATAMQGVPYPDGETRRSGPISEVVLELAQHVVGDEPLRVVVRFHETFRRQFHDAAVCKRQSSVGTGFSGHGSPGLQVNDFGRVGSGRVAGQCDRPGV